MSVNHLTSFKTLFQELYPGMVKIALFYIHDLFSNTIPRLSPSSDFAPNLDSRLFGYKGSAINNLVSD